MITEFVGMTAIFVVLSPFVAFAVMAAGKYSSLDDLNKRREWHRELFVKSA